MKAKYCKHTPLYLFTNSGAAVCLLTSRDLRTIDLASQIIEPIARWSTVQQSQTTRTEQGWLKIQCGSKS